jgi:hypothetical protein
MPALIRAPVPWWQRKKAQRMLLSKRAGSTVAEVKSSHSVFLSHPQAVAHLIEQAATDALVATKEGATNAAAD